MLALILLALPLASCGENGENGSQKADKGEAYVSLDINPAIEITIENGKVTAVYAANEDARVLLYGEEGIVGCTVDEAIAKITQIAIDNGYLAEENHVVNILSSGLSEEKIEAVKTKVAEAVQDCGFTISLDEGITFSLERQLAEFKAKYPDDKAIQALTPTNFKLALSASEAGNVELEVAVKMDEKTLVAYLNDVYLTAENFATEAYQKAKEMANAAYEQAEVLAVSAVYADLYNKYATSHKNTIYYGAVYKIYQTLAVSLNAYASLLAKLEETGVTEYEVKEENLDAVMEAFGLEKNSEEANAVKEQMKNENGKITLASLEAYCDKYVKNATAEQKQSLETVKTALSEALKTTEEAWKDAFFTVAQTTYLQIDALLTACNLTLTTMDVTVTAASLLNKDLKDAFTTYKNNINGLVTTLKAMMEENANAPLNSSSLSQIATTLKLKANELKKLMDEDLSDEEKKEIETNITALKDALDGYKATYDAALTQAENIAKAYLQQAKNKRSGK